MSILQNDTTLNPTEDTTPKCPEPGDTPEKFKAWIAYCRQGYEAHFAGHQRKVVEPDTVYSDAAQLSAVFRERESREGKAKK